VNESLSELRRSLAGSVIAPGDAEYDAARRCFNALVDRRPAVIGRCAVAGDVATAFDFARTHELDVAVRGGGHNPAGHCVSDGGLVIDLSSMRTVDVDGEARIARADGSRWLGEVLLDQTLVAGIGNMWMAEALWRARLSPWRRLRDAAAEERRLALETAASLMRASVETGREPRKQVYGRAGRPCPRCGGRIRAWGQGDANRTTYWCERCQVGEAPRAA